MSSGRCLQYYYVILHACESLCPGFNTGKNAQVPIRNYGAILIYRIIVEPSGTSIVPILPGGVSDVRVEDASVGLTNQNTPQVVPQA
jgi:hypothetical protein